MGGTWRKSERPVADPIPSGNETGRPKPPRPQSRPTPERVVDQTE